MAVLGIVALGVAAVPGSAAAQAGMGTDNAPQATYAEREALVGEPLAVNTAAQPFAVKSADPVPPAPGPPAEVPPPPA
ncbi:MAG: hypothetical protein ACRD26_09230, partial [Vicinamibacterales bacterium]